MTNRINDFFNRMSNWSTETWSWAHHVRHNTTAHMGYLLDPEQRIKSILQSENFYDSLMDSIRVYRDIKKFATLPSSLGFEEWDMEILVRLLQQDPRFTGLRFEVKKYDWVNHLRISWDHIQWHGRYCGSVTGNSDELTWVGNPLSMQAGGWNAVLVYNNLLTVMDS